MHCCVLGDMSIISPLPTGFKAVGHSCSEHNAQFMKVSLPRPNLLLLVTGSLGSKQHIHQDCAQHGARIPGVEAGAQYAMTSIPRGLFSLGFQDVCGTDMLAGK